MPRRKPRFPQRHDIVQMDDAAHLVTWANHDALVKQWMFNIACDVERMPMHRMMPHFHRAPKVTCLECLAWEDRSLEGGDW